MQKINKRSDQSGIRTHASEETGALNQRLRPLGHLTTLRFALISEHPTARSEPAGFVGQVIAVVKVLIFSHKSQILDIHLKM